MALVSPRIKIMSEGILYDFSPRQIEILSKKVIKIPAEPDWKTSQALTSLLGKRMIRKTKGEYVRTSLGLTILEKLRARDKKNKKAKER